jgi:hypothetical protein
MSALQPPLRQRNRKLTSRVSRYFRPKVETLECRRLLSVAGWPEWLAPRPTALPAAVGALEYARTLDFVADPNGAVSLQAAGAVGRIGNQGGAGTVDWYSFTLSAASDVQLTVFDAVDGNHLNGVLSLYNSEAFDPFYPLSFSAPPFNPQQHRLLAQTETASLTRSLAAGTYYLAVSGQGNRYFNPFIPGSGYAGDTGDYRLLVAVNPLPLGTNDGPRVLAVDPQIAGAQAGVSVLHGSPLAIHVDFSSPIDPSTVSLVQPWSSPGDPPPSVQLTYSPTGDFGDENDRPVFFTGYYYSRDATELQLQPAAPLRAGYYQLTLAGAPGDLFHPVLTDATNMLNLGQNQDHPTGQDFTTTFQIDGAEGAIGREESADDTPAGARLLPKLAQNALVQIVGVVGDDSAYDPALPFRDPADGAPYLTNPSSDVDLYRFQITGTASYDFAVEVFAGRVGSTLDAAVSLFRFDENNAGGPLQLIASNDNSSNTAVTTDGRARPLFTDPVLDVGLGAGDYYLAISASGNMPDLSGNGLGANGVFDPNISHSGAGGGSTGAYVLNMLLQRAAPAPHVSATSIAPGAVLTSAPTRLTVAFDGHVNLTALANRAFNATTESTVSGVFLLGPDGQRFFPRLESFSEATGQAEFLLLDRLPNGANELHLSGARGLTGFGGVPLVGNDASGDYVVAFTVDDPTAPNDPLIRAHDVSAHDSSEVRDLGILFPRELQAGVAVTGTLAAPAADGAPDSNTYTIQLLQSQKYHFLLTGPAEGADAPQMTITDALGAVVTPLAENIPNAFFASLLPGVCTIQIRGLADGAGAGPYRLLITLLNDPENPPPLSIGATPVLQIRPVANPPPLPPTSPIQGPTQGPTTGPTAQPAPLSITPVSLTPAATATPAPGPTLIVRADILGGVTKPESGNLIETAPPLQVQGLTNAPPAAANNALLAGSTLLTVLFLVPAPRVVEPTPENIDTTFDAVWAFFQSSLELGARWLDSVPNRDRRPVAPLVLEQPPRRDAEPAPPLIVVVESSAAPTTNTTLATAEYEDARWAQAMQQWSEEQTAASADTPSRSEPPRNSATWIGATFGAVLAAFSVWKSLHAPAAPTAAAERQTPSRKRPDDVGNDATTVIPQ